MGSLGADVGRSSSVVEGRVVGFRFVSKSLIDGVGFASSAYCSGAFRFRRGRFSIAFWTGRVLTTMSLARGMGVGARGAEGRAHLHEGVLPSGEHGEGWWVGGVAQTERG